MTRMRTAMGRLGLLATVALLTTGPAPGKVGGCGQGVKVGDPAAYCRNSKALICARMEARGELTKEEKNDCVALVADDCSGIQDWPGDCDPIPTQREVNACIEQLQLQSNLSKDVRDIPACEICGNYPTSPLEDGMSSEMEMDGGMSGDASLPDGSLLDGSMPDGGAVDAGRDGGVAGDAAVDASATMDGGGA